MNYLNNGQITNAPKKGEIVFVAHPFDPRGYQDIKYDPVSTFCVNLFKRGFLFDNPESAKAVTEEMKKAVSNTVDCITVEPFDWDKVYLVTPFEIKRNHESIRYDRYSKKCIWLFKNGWLFKTLQDAIAATESMKKIINQIKKSQHKCWRGR